MPLWIDHCTINIMLLLRVLCKIVTLDDIYPFRCWHTLRHFFHCGTNAFKLRKDNAYTVFSFPAINSISFSFHCEYLSPCVIHSVNFSLFLSLESLSHQKFPSIKCFPHCSISQYPFVSFWSSATRRRTQRDFHSILILLDASQ